MRNLPSGWTTVSIGDLCRLINGRAFKPTDWTPTGLPIVRIQNLNNEEAPFNRFSGEVDERFLIDSGELLFAWSGTPGTSFGAHIWNRGKAILNQHIFRVLFDSSVVEKRFLRLAINERLDHLIGMAHGGAGLAHVTKPMFESTRVLLPPRPEQDRIVAEVEKQNTRLDAGVAALKRVQAQLKRYRASVLKAACEGRLVPTEAELARCEKRDYEPADKLLARILKERRARWEADQLAKMKTSGKKPKDDKWKLKYVEPAPPRLESLPSLPAGWTYASLSQLAFVASGNTPKGVEEKVAPAGEIPWLKVGDMNRPGNEKYLQEADAWLSKDAAAALGMHVQPKGTIVFPKRGGAIATNKKRRLAVPSCYDLNCMGLIPLPTVSEYIWWWFASINLGTLSDGANIPQLNHGDIKPLVVPLPPLQEQSRIVTEVEARLSVVEVAEIAIASNETRAAHLRQAVLKTAFKGALVPQDPRDDHASKLLERIFAAVENKPLPKQGRAKQTTAVPKMKATR